MARLFTLLVAGLSFLQFAGAVGAVDFKLADGTSLKGEATGVNQEGLVVKLEVGGFSPRISWARLSQETLRELAADPKLKPFAEPFIELPPEEIQKARAKKKEIVLKPVPNRLDPLPAKPGLLAAFTSPAGLLILAALFAANMFAGYEIAVFRHRPAALVCGLSAVFPVITPLLFLVMPPAPTTPEDAAAHEAAAADQPAAPAAAGAGGLSIASGHSPAAGVSPLLNQTFSRSDTTFNRRFFETKFPGFFRLVPAEAEKDLVLVIRTPKGEYVGRRITRISMNELHLQMQKGGGTTESMILFAEIGEVKVRLKDATT